VLSNAAEECCGLVSFDVVGSGVDDVDPIGEMKSCSVSIAEWIGEFGFVPAPV